MQKYRRSHSFLPQYWWRNLNFGLRLYLEKLSDSISLSQVFSHISTFQTMVPLLPGRYHSPEALWMWDGFFGAWKEWNHEPIQALVTFVSFRFSEVFKLSSCFRTMACSVWWTHGQFHQRSAKLVMVKLLWLNLNIPCHNPPCSAAAPGILRCGSQTPFFVTSFFWFQAAWKLILALLRGQGLQICYVCHLDHLGHLDHRDHLGHLDHLLQELPWWKEADGRWIRSGIIRLPIFWGIKQAANLL